MGVTVVASVAAQLTSVGQDRGATEHAYSAASPPLLERFQGRGSGWDEDAKRARVRWPKNVGDNGIRDKRKFLAASNDVGWSVQWHRPLTYRTVSEERRRAVISQASSS